jgi:hypothetical protein
MMASPSHDPDSQSDYSQESSRSSPSPSEEQPIRPEQPHLYLGDHSNFDNAYGFRIYRTTYGDNDKWDRFMSYFRANVEQSLGKDEEYKPQLLRVDWAVQSSPYLHDATIDEVRE